MNHGEPRRLKSCRDWQVKCQNVNRGERRLIILMGQEYSSYTSTGNLVCKKQFVGVLGEKTNVMRGEGIPVLTLCNCGGAGVWLAPKRECHSE